MQTEVACGEAMAMKFPEQVVIAVAKDTSGKCNPITLGWTMITSGSPPMMAISIGHGRYSLGVFRNADEFVIAMPSEHQAEETLLFGTRSGRDVDKFAEANTTLQPAAEVDCVLLADAAANFECRKVAELETGDHVLFVGEVVRSHINPDKPSRLYTVGSGYKMGGLARVTD